MIVTIRAEREVGLTFQQESVWGEAGFEVYCIYRPHQVMVYLYNHVNKIDRQSSRPGGLKLRKKATQASLFNEGVRNC